MEKIRVRFAPSPTGFIHVGNARTALFNWLFARHKKGTYILRIEDTDIERSRREYEKNLIEGLRWLGLDWDEGPDIGGDKSPYRQSERSNLYHKYSMKLLEEGKAYYCFCKPEELEQERQKALSSGNMPVYSGKCRSIPLDEAKKLKDSGKPAAIRLCIPDKGIFSYEDLIRGKLNFDLELIGDPIIVRSNGYPSYNYAVVIDDALMDVTHVIRGEDHISNTPRQILTYRALSWPVPEFAHLSMVMGKDNTRLSKRHGATSVDQFEQKGVLPEALFNYLALLGWSPPGENEIFSKHELAKLFDLHKVSRSSAIFDYEKLFWVNRQYIKQISQEEIAEHAFLYLNKAKLVPENLTNDQFNWLKKAAGVLSERIDVFSDFPREFRLFFDFNPAHMEREAESCLKTDSAKKVACLLKEKLPDYSNMDFKKFSELAQEIKKESGVKGKDLYHPIRVALTGETSGLDLDKFIPLVEEGSKLNFPIPVKNCLQRVSEVLKQIG
ncbi:MAG: glutamate--tRNA ligase [Candidatus Aminicenantaceae bacterium]